MPKSKRDRTISLTATKKKGLEFKQNLITEIRECLDSYENFFVISMFNQRNIFLKDLRQKWSDSKFLFGKNKVIALALGKGPESEYKENLHQISSHLNGNIGLLFTNKSKAEVLKYFASFSCPDYARSGNIATDEVTLCAGPLEQFQHTMEPQLRQLGLRTSLVKGVVHLDTEHVVCRIGDKLTSEQARLLKLFEEKQATFKVNVKVYWNKEGIIEILDASVDDTAEDVEMSGDDENNNVKEEEMSEEDLPKSKKQKKHQK